MTSLNERGCWGQINIYFNQCLNLKVSRRNPFNKWLIYYLEGSFRNLYEIRVQQLMSSASSGSFHLSRTPGCFFILEIKITAGSCQEEEWTKKPPRQEAPQNRKLGCFLFKSVTKALNKAREGHFSQSERETIQAATQSKFRFHTKSFLSTILGPHTVNVNYPRRLE